MKITFLGSNDSSSLRWPLFLLISVYVYIFAQLCNFENTWNHPENNTIESAYLKTGIGFTGKDFFNIWDWRIDEEMAPRTTRWLSWCLDLVNFKFRAWLWQWVPPHPSFSITWLLSLAINPWLFYAYLKMRRFSIEIALTAVAFYLMTPYVLSSVFMLGRTGKILAHFFMLIALGMVCLIKNRPEKKLYPIGFYLSLMLGAFCDETGCFIFPLLFFLHPEFVFKKTRWLWMLFIMFLISAAYVWGIGMMSHYVSGTPLIGLPQYDVIQRIFNNDFITLFLNHLGINSLAPLSQIMGLIWVHPKAPLAAKLFFSAGALAWLALALMALRRKNFLDTPLRNIFPWVTMFFLAFLFHNFLLSSVWNQVWGSYGYGSYFSIIFTLALAAFLNFLKLGNIVRTLLIACILCSMGSTFLYTNRFIKNVNYYHIGGQERFIFDANAKYFDPQAGNIFTDKQLKENIYVAWKSPDNYLQWRMPDELFWLVIELNAFKKDFILTSPKHEKNEFCYSYFPTNEPFMIDLTLDNVVRLDEGDISFVSNMSAFGPFWKNGDEIYFHPSNQGSKIGFLLRFKKAFHSNLSLTLTTAFDAGTVEILLNNTPVSTGPIDLYSRGVNIKKVELKDIYFKAGENILSIMVVGKNALSSSLGVGVDTISITPIVDKI